MAQCFLSNTRRASSGVVKKRYFSILRLTVCLVLGHFHSKWGVITWFYHPKDEFAIEMTLPSGVNTVWGSIIRFDLVKLKYVILTFTVCTRIWWLPIHMKYYEWLTLAALSIVNTTRPSTDFWQAGKFVFFCDNHCTPRI